MKPFNLEEAKAGKPVQTKAGNPVRIICFDKVSNDFRPIVALVTYKNSSGEFEMLMRAATDGTVLCGKIYDLCMAPVKHTGWINLYPQCGRVNTSDLLYATREDAEEYGVKGAITVEVEWEE